MSFSAPELCNEKTWMPGTSPGKGIFWSGTSLGMTVSDVRYLCDRRLERSGPAEDRARQHLDLLRWGGWGERLQSADPPRGQGGARRHAGGGERARRAGRCGLRLSVRLPRRVCRPAEPHRNAVAVLVG